jgi:hypothetical protein
MEKKCKKKISGRAWARPKWLGPNRPRPGLAVLAGLLTSLLKIFKKIIIIGNK